MHNLINMPWKNKIIATWLGILCILIIIMVSLGGYTRLTNSGLSITEWKPISGIIPPTSESDWQVEFSKYQDSPEFQQINNDMTISEFKHIYIIEFAHRVLGRLIAMALILPFLYLGFSGYFNQKEVYYTSLKNYSLNITWYSRVLTYFNISCARSPFIRPLRKLATEEQVQGAYGAQNRNVHKVHEDLSTEATKQLPSVVEFPKRSIFKFNSPNIGSIFIYLFAIILLFSQGLMGWYMVKSGLVNEPHVSHLRLSAHLLLACLLYITLLWQFFCQFKQIILVENTKDLNSCWHLAIVSIILLLVQITFGGFVAGLKAGLIYNEFPLMDGRFVPSELDNIQINWQLFYNPVFVQFLHRITAYLVLIINIILYIRIRKLGSTQLISASQLMLILTLLQALIGVLTLLYIVPLNLAMTHQFGAMILLSSSLWVCYLLNLAEQK